MDINSKIDWKPGMEITAQTFAELDSNLDLRQALAAKVSLNGQFGILPGFDYSCRANFVNNNLEIDGFSCTAILPSGKILCVSEDVSVNIPLLYGSVYYLAVEFSDTVSYFEKQDVRFVRPQYKYSFYTLEDLAKNDCLPFLKFNIKDGIFSIDYDYIPPYLMSSSSEVFSKFKDTYIGQLEKILAHHNLREGGGKRVLSQYLFKLKGLEADINVSRFAALIDEIAQAANYYLVCALSDTPAPVPVYSKYDVQEYLSKIEEYINGVTTILDNAVINELTIPEYMELIRKELRAYAEGELHDKLLEELKEQLRAELSSSLREELTDFVCSAFKQQLHSQLHDELTEELKDKLYKILYEALYNALYVQPEAEEEKNDFMPLI